MPVISLALSWTAQGYEVFGAGTMKEAKEYIAKGTADIILLDVKLPDGYGPTLLEDTARMPVRPPIILITAYGDIEMAVDAMKNGAHDFLPKPIQFARLESSIQRACESVAMRRELAHFRQAQHQDLDFIIGSNPVMQRVYDQARRACGYFVIGIDHRRNGNRKRDPRQSDSQVWSSLPEAVHGYQLPGDPEYGIRVGAVRLRTGSIYLRGETQTRTDGSCRRRSALPR